MSTGRAFDWRCRHCGAIVHVVGRLTTAALAALRDHVGDAHREAGMPAEAHAGTILGAFDVEAAC